MKANAARAMVVTGARLAAIVAASMLVTACLDNIGPRPRPGGEIAPPTQQSASLLWYETVPRVITQGQTDSIRLDVNVSGTPDAVVVGLRNGAQIALRRVGTTSVYSAMLSANSLLFGYRAGDLHVVGGFIDVRRGVRSDENSLLINVKDATVPTVTAQAVAPGIQAAPHVVNIRYDSLYLGARAPAAVLKTFYANFSDEYEFVAVVQQVRSPHERLFTGVRNRISGLGLAQFDDGRTFGSDSTLQGLISYPVDAALDLAETSNIHYIAHRWMNYLRQPALATGIPHWPLSDLAFGVMGWSDPVTRAALLFPFAVVAQSNGTFLLQTNDRPRAFNDLELYLMGLLPGDSVQPHVVFRDQNQGSQIRNNGVLRGPVDTVRIADIVARDGPRIPAAGAAPRQFRIATIILSKGGLLTREELSFFEHMAARGEQTVGLQYSTGLSAGITLPFFVATEGRGVLITKLRPAALK